MTEEVESVHETVSEPGLLGVGEASTAVAGAGLVVKSPDEE